MEENNKKRVSFGSVLAKISSPIGIVISMGVAIGALVIVLITNQVQDCTKSKDGFATVNYHISTAYAGYAVFITEVGGTDPIRAFITGRNEDVQQSIKPGQYDIHGYYVDLDQSDLMRDLVRSGLYLPDIDSYSGYDVESDIRLCDGNEYHILAWVQPN